MSSSKPVTAVVHMSLKDGISLEQLLDTSSEAGKAWGTLQSTILSQPGAERLYWSTEVENPSQLRLFMDWSSLDHRLAMKNSSGYKSLVFRDDYTTEKPVDYHVNFEPHPPSILSEPGATEVVTVYFPSSVSESDAKDYEARMHKLVSRITDNVTDGGFKGSSMGWAVEDDIPFHDGKGDRGRVFVLFLGWASVQAHMDFRDTPHFKGIPELVLAPYSKTRRMIHVQCRTVEK